MNMTITWTKLFNRFVYVGSRLGHVKLRFASMLGKFKIELLELFGNREGDEVRS